MAMDQENQEAPKTESAPAPEAAAAPAAAPEEHRPPRGPRGGGRGGRGRGRGGDRREGDRGGPREGGGLVEKVVAVNRVAESGQGGPRLSFHALVALRRWQGHGRDANGQ